MFLATIVVFCCCVIAIKLVWNSNSHQSNRTGRPWRLWGRKKTSNCKIKHLRSETLNIETKRTGILLQRWLLQNESASQGLFCSGWWRKCSWGKSCVSWTMKRVLERKALTRLRQTSWFDRACLGSCEVGTRSRSASGFCRTATSSSQFHSETRMEGRNRWLLNMM